MVLDRIQEHLEAIYGLRCEERASRYLVVDQHHAQALGATGRTREELLVDESDGALDVALYVAPEVLARIEHRSAADAVNDELREFCEAAEGVSHFMYLQRAAQLERTVSLLELETQGEVDKFAACALSTWQHGALFARALFTRLFEAVSFNDALKPAERWRYQRANSLGRGYCLKLLRHVIARRSDLLLTELRHSYRLGADAKLAYFAAAAR